MEAVDLGLSVKWATCNVGASSPEEYGSYFAWGEIEPKTTYSWSTYKWATAKYDEELDWWDLETITKYNTISDDSTVDNKTVLESEDDAATTNWGGQWRMPTDAEWTELRTKCTWIWIENYKETGIKGYEVKGTNGNSIFLPVNGCHDCDGLEHIGDGYYWSSSLHVDNASSFSAWNVDFGLYNVFRNFIARYLGQLVRPVLSND